MGFIFLICRHIYCCIQRRVFRKIKVSSLCINITNSNRFILQLASLCMHIGRMRLHIGCVRLHIGCVRLHIGRMRLHLGRMRLHIGRMRLYLGCMRIHIGRMRLLYLFDFRPLLKSLRKCIGNNHGLKDTVVVECIRGYNILRLG